MMLDLRHALHRCRRAPFASAGVVLSVSAVVAMVTTLVVLLHAIELGAMTVSDPDSIVALWRRVPGFQSRILASRWEYSEWRVRNRSFTAVAAVKLRPFDLGTEQGFERIRGAEVSPDLFAVLGARPTVGRLFSNDMLPATERLVVLGEALWRRRFGADPAIVGKYIRLSDGQATLFRVLGVVAALPLLRSDNTPEDVFTVLLDQRDLVVSRSDSSYWVYARLRPGASLRAATDDMDVMTAEMGVEAKDGLPIRVVATTLRDAVVAPVRPVLLVLAVIASLMVLAGCAYLANMRLALLWARADEIRMRIALGGQGWQVARGYVIEGLGLVSCGGGDWTGAGADWGARDFPYFAGAAGVAAEHTAVLRGCRRCWCCCSCDSIDRRLWPRLAGGDRLRACGDWYQTFRAKDQRLAARDPVGRNVRAALVGTGDRRKCLAPLESRRWI